MGEHITGGDGPASEAVAAANGQLREGILEISPIPIAVLNTDRRVVLANDRAEQELGLREDELLGLNTQDSALSAVHEDGTPVGEGEGITTEILAEGEPVQNRVYRVDMPTGQSIWLSISGTPLFEDGDVAYIVLAFENITERKERERELAEKTEELERTVDRLERTNAELEQFAYVASHDLQEPLRMISSYLDLLEMEYEDRLDAEAEEYIDYAVDGAERMREMIDDLLQFSRVQTREEEFERQPVGDVLDEALDNLALAIEEADGTITRDELPTLPVDDHQLRQLFQNLVENALNYAGDAPPRVHVGATEQDDAWELTVADEGVGIPESEQDRIFDIFMRGAGTEEGGSGIGLAICKRVVENHGGDITVESAPGEGTTFRFTLSKQPRGSSERGGV